MAQEIELKARVDDLESLRAELRRRGATLSTERAFEDNYLFDQSDAQLARRGTALRVRLFAGRARLTFKGARTVVDGVKSREELEVECDDGQVLMALLDRLGYRQAFRYQKYREVWQLNAVEVMLDETPIGLFAEVEGAEADVREASAALGLTTSVVEQSYAALFRGALMARGESLDAMTFDEPPPE